MKAPASAIILGVIATLLAIYIASGIFISISNTRNRTKVFVHLSENKVDAIMRLPKGSYAVSICNDSLIPISEEEANTHIRLSNPDGSLINEATSTRFRFTVGDSTYLPLRLSVVSTTKAKADLFVELRATF